MDEGYSQSMHKNTYKYNKIMVLFWKSFKYLRLSFQCFLRSVYLVSLWFFTFENHTQDLQTLFLFLHEKETPVASFFFTIIW